MFIALRGQRMLATAAFAGLIVIAASIGASADDTIKITFENTLENQAVKLRIWDKAIPSSSSLDIDSIGPAKVSGVKNTAEFNAKKGKTSGKYTIEVSWNCRNVNGKGYSHGGTAEYEDSVSKIQIVKAGDGCELKGAKKKEKKSVAPPEKIKITFENTLDNQAVSLNIWDDAVSGVKTEISSIAAATLNGKPSGAKNTIDYAATKDKKSGKYTIEVNWNCHNVNGKGYSHGGTAEYEDSVSKIEIVPTTDGGCELKGAKKKEKKSAK